jgi:hypothetical protein
MWGIVRWGWGLGMGMMRSRLMCVSVFIFLDGFGCDGGIPFGGVF